jgi:hypothetical protein
MFIKHRVNAMSSVQTPRSRRAAVIPGEASSLDARIRRRSDTGELLEMARRLPEADRVLVERCLGLGLPATAVAASRGQNPRLVQRRVRKLVRSMKDPVFRFLCNHGKLLPKALRRTGESAVFEGKPLRQVGLATGQSLHRVRQQITTLRALAALKR